MSARDEPSGPSVADNFDLEFRTGYLMRRGVKFLSLIWAANVPGMTIPQFAILVELDLNSGLDQRTLGERVLTDPSTTADMCRRLLARGHIERARDPADHRRYLVRITSSGREVLKSALPLAEQADDLLLARLSPAEKQRFVQLFRKALDVK